MAKIFCVEDDLSIRELIVYALNNSGFDATGFENSMELFNAIEQEPALILLDIMLPDEDGLSILKKLKGNHRTKDIPVILLTAKSSEFDKVMGLDSGADDYIVKPFGVMELLSRIKALLRRTNREDKKDELVIGSLNLNYTQHTVKVNEQECFLTHKEFELLYYLMMNRNIVLTRDKLMQKVWGFDFEGESRTVDMHIKALRQKLGDAGELIQTVRGVGYRITYNA